MTLTTGNKTVDRIVVASLTLAGAVALGTTFESEKYQIGTKDIKEIERIRGESTAIVYAENCLNDAPNLGGIYLGVYRACADYHAKHVIPSKNITVRPLSPEDI